MIRREDGGGLEEYIAVEVVNVICINRKGSSAESWYPDSYISNTSLAFTAAVAVMIQTRSDSVAGSTQGILVVSVSV